MPYGDRVKLLSIQKQDYRDMFNLVNDKKVMDFVDIFKPVSWPQHIEYVRNLHEDKNTILFVIRDQVTNQFLGTIQLTDIDWVSKTAEMRVRLTTASSGKGHGTDALTCLVKYAEETLGLRKIWLRVFSTNAPAMKLYNKLGFTQEGQLKEHILINGEYVDLILMSLLTKQPE